MATITWPAILKPRDFGFYPLNPDRSGGEGLSGGEQIVTSPGGRWGASGVFPIISDQHVLAARALRAQLKGRVNDIALPNFDGRRLSWPIEVFNGKETGVVLTPKVTRNTALDGTAYEDDEIPSESEINATVNANAAIRATSIAINLAQGEPILAGQQFGVGQRIYEIGTIDSVAASVYTVSFWPPLRAAATATTAVLFTRPVCKMRLADPGQVLRELELLRFARDLHMDFVEANW